MTQTAVTDPESRDTSPGQGEVQQEGQVTLTLTLPRPPLAARHCHPAPTRQMTLPVLVFLLRLDDSASVFWSWHCLNVS